MSYALPFVHTLILQTNHPYGGDGMTKYAAISVVWNQSSAVKRVIGTVEKPAGGALFGQDMPWEPRLDNGYPNVVRSGKNWQLWYGDCVKGCGTQLLLYANSTDGFLWKKPELGLFDLGSVRPDLKSIGTKNNIVMLGGGIGVYDDGDHDPDPARRFKAFGGTMKVGGKSFRGTAVSADGLHWDNGTADSWPAPQRYDCHNNLFWDGPSNKYIATTRDGFSGGSGRDIGIDLSLEGAFKFNTSKAPTLVEEGTAPHQLYSQITWRWHNIFLGIVMVFDAQDKERTSPSRPSHTPTRPTPSIPLPTTSIPAQHSTAIAQHSLA